MLHALALRRWHERRIRAVIRGIRDGRHALPPDAPLAVIAAHRDADGALLTVRRAVVEAINILRPTVPIGRFIGFAAVALHQHPEWRERFAAGDLEGLRPFAEEVRRHYPFFPVVGGRVCCAFEWRGHAFEPGDWVIVNLYGTDHDPRSHPEPEAFRPGRGLDWRDQGFAFVPQGGGDSHRSHRCPGEAVTVALLAEAVRLLCTGLRWEVPPQDLTIDLATMPARPASGVRLSGLQLA